MSKNYLMRKIITIVIPSNRMCSNYLVHSLGCNLELIAGQSGHRINKEIAIIVV